MTTIGNVVDDMLNVQSKLSNVRIVYVDLDDLCLNPLNPVPQSQLEDERVNEMIKSIREGGLIQPIVVEERDGKKFIISGNTRFKAVKKINENEETYYFLQRECDGEIPCILKAPSKNETEEVITQLRSNRYRQYTKEERYEIVCKAHECYEMMTSTGQKPKGREREWITTLTGISDGTVKSILAELNQENELGAICPGNSRRGSSKKRKKHRRKNIEEAQ